MAFGAHGPGSEHQCAARRGCCDSQSKQADQSRLQNISITPGGRKLDRNQQIETQTGLFERVRNPGTDSMDQAHGIEPSVDCISARAAVQSIFELTAPLLGSDDRGHTPLDGNAESFVRTPDGLLDQLLEAEYCLVQRLVDLSL